MKKRLLWIMVILGLVVWFIARSQEQLELGFFS